MEWAIPVAALLVSVSALVFTVLSARAALTSKDLEEVRRALAECRAARDALERERVMLLERIAEIRSPK